MNGDYILLNDGSILNLSNIVRIFKTTTSSVAGKTRKLQKSSPAYQFKRPWWRCVGEMKYIPAKRIPKNYRVVA